MLHYRSVCARVLKVRQDSEDVKSRPVRSIIALALERSVCSFAAWQRACVHAHASVMPDEKTQQCARFPLHSPADIVVRHTSCAAVGWVSVCKGVRSGEEGKRSGRPVVWWNEEWSMLGAGNGALLLQLGLPEPLQPWSVQSRRRKRWHFLIFIAYSCSSCSRTGTDSLLFVLSSPEPHLPQRYDMTHKTLTVFCYNQSLCFVLLVFLQRSVGLALPSPVWFSCPEFDWCVQAHCNAHDVPDFKWSLTFSLSFSLSELYLFVDLNVAFSIVNCEWALL